MFKKCINHIWLPMAVITALIAILFVAVPVFAQDEAPAEPAPEVAPVEEMASEEAPIEDSATEESPETVEIVATNVEGEVLPLASQEAAEVLAGGDPWWKVGTHTYRYLRDIGDPTICTPFIAAGETCVIHATPIQAAINYISGNATAIPTDGKIYVEGDTYSDTILIDGANVNLVKLKGLVGSLSPSTNLPTVILPNSTITIQNMPGAFLLSGFDVTGNLPDGVVRLFNNAGAVTLQDLVVVNSNASGTAAGIYAEQTGAITLTRVDSSGNTSNGAYLKNDTGTGGVTITNASFDDNHGIVGAALTIISKGAITLNNVSVARNDATGVSISSLKSLLVKNSTFHHNTGNGLTVSTGSLGAVNLENVYLLNNTSDGADIWVGGVVNFKNVFADNNYRLGTRIITNGFPGYGHVTITNSSFSYNHQHEYSDTQSGLIVWAKGAITLTGVTASHNGIYVDAITNALTGGATLDNDDADKPANITITQGAFDGNYWVGLRISTKGSVKLNAISASSNGIWAVPVADIHGMDIDADEGSGSVTLTSTLGDSYFDNNDGIGIRIIAKGNISLSGKVDGGSSSSLNGTGTSGYGMSIVNTAGAGAVAVKHFNISNNQNIGLRIRSNGAITLEKLNVNANGLGAESIGADIANNSAPSAKAVIITASNFQGNNGEGLHVYTRGSVTLNGITASYNTSATSDPSGAIISASDGTGAVTLLGTKGANSFTNNDGSGLSIFANGKVSLESLTAYFNANSYGVYVRTNTAGDVSVKKLTSYSNGNAGLHITAFGNITVDNTTVYGNGLTFALNSGAYLDNAGGTLAKFITVTRSSFYNTPSWGLHVVSRGLITINNVAAYNNTSDGGAWLANSDAGVTAGVSVLSSYGENSFKDNAGDGLYILTNGPVTMSKVVAVYNHGDGVSVYNTGGTGGVTISRGDFQNNYASALYILTNGKISVSDVIATTNGTTYASNALYLDNSGSPVIESTVTILRTSVYDHQLGTGIYIFSKGAVTLNTVTSSGNSALGAYGLNIDNRLSSKNAGISILAGYGRNDFSSNALYGLDLQSNGTITITKADVYSNGGNGARLQNQTGTGSVIITDSYFSSNPNGNGISISTYGKVTWSGGGASSNGTSASGFGAQIVNSSSPTPMPVSISKAIFSGNYGDGLKVQANGQITLNKVSAYSNAFGGSAYGAYLENYGGSGGVSVLSSYGANQFNYNDADGLNIHTAGTVILSKVTSQDNGGYGVWVGNAEGSSTASVSITTGALTYNYLNGIYVESYGNITLLGIHASENGYGGGSGDGAGLDNLGGVSKYVKVTNSTFENNDGFGLYAQSNGAITLSGITSKHNNSSGASLINDAGTGNISILKSNFLENHNNGIDIISAGLVTISGVTANVNDGIGMYIGNTSGTANVTISSSYANGNGAEGVTALSRGVVTISSGKMEDNNGYGARLINTADISGTKGVTVKNSTFSSNSGGYGLRVESHGAVLLTTIKAENNNGEGAWINNLAGTTTGTPTVTISGINSFSNNNNDGLVVYGKGVVTLAGITASNNNGVGMFLNTDTGSAINVSNATLKQNNENGIYAISGGVITISGMVVLFNGTTANFTGAYLSAIGYDITIKNSAFNANGASGIVAYTGATHTLYLTGVNYFGNDYFGGIAEPDLSFDGHLVLN